MRILVTGGAGFIGSHLSEMLLTQQNHVTVIDDLNDCYSPNLKKRNLVGIESNSNATFIQLDICDQVSLNSVFARSKPEIVIHLAARTGVRKSLSAPSEYERVNVYGTVALLEACRDNSVRKIIFASSSSVYGVLDSEHPIAEDDVTGRCISPYAATKLFGENIIFTYSHLYKIDAICLRLFTVYGPRQRPDLAIRYFTESIETGRPVHIHGDGSTARDYTHVSDVVNAIVASIEYDSRYEIFNIGSASPITLKSLIQILEDALGQTADIVEMPNQPGDVPYTFANISKARALLRYQPKIPFVEGIRQFIAWRRQEAMHLIKPDSFY